MSTEAPWLVPQHDLDFHCKGGACRHTCCAWWPVTVSMEEYFRLIGMDCSEKLHREIEGALHLVELPSKDYYAQITPNWRGECPMHSPDGWCALQLECGEEALPELCRVYPRSLQWDGTRKLCVCSASCEAEVERLLHLREPLQLVKTVMLTQHPELREQVPEGAAEALQGVLRAMQHRERTLPERLRDVAEQLGAPVAAQPADAQAALHVMMALVPGMLEDSASLWHYAGNVLERYAQPDRRLAAWQGDDGTLNRLLPDWPVFLEQLLCNHLCYEHFPYGDARLGKAEAWTGLVVLYGLLRLIIAGVVAREAASETAQREQALVDAVAGTFRFVEHTGFSCNAAHDLRRLGLRADAVLGL